MSSKRQPRSTSRPATVTIPEFEPSMTAVLNTLASEHSRRSYQYAIDRFIAWYGSSRGQEAAQVAASMGEAAKTVRAVAGATRRKAGVSAAGKGEARPTAGAGRGPEPTDPCHGVRFAATGHSAVERAPDRHRSGEAEARAAGGAGDGPHPAYRATN